MSGSPTVGVSLSSHQSWERTPVRSHLPNNGHCLTQFPSLTCKYLCGLHLHFWFLTSLRSISAWVTELFGFLPPWNALDLFCYWIFFSLILYGFWILILSHFRCYRNYAGVFWWKDTCNFNVTVYWSFRICNVCLNIHLNCLLKFYNLPFLKNLI